MTNQDNQNNNYLIEPDQNSSIEQLPLGRATGDSHKNNANKKRYMLIFLNKLPEI